MWKDGRSRGSSRGAAQAEGECAEISAIHRKGAVALAGCGRGASELHLTAPSWRTHSHELARRAATRATCRPPRSPPVSPARAQNAHTRQVAPRTARPRSSARVSREHRSNLGTGESESSCGQRRIAHKSPVSSTRASEPLVSTFQFPTIRGRLCLPSGGRESINDDVPLSSCCSLSLAACKWPAAAGAETKSNKVASRRTARRLNLD